jgi:hypothetical protein
VRKMQRFIAHRLRGRDGMWGNLARHEWLSRALDDIGTCEVVSSSVLPHSIFNVHLSRNIWVRQRPVLELARVLALER